MTAIRYRWTDGGEPREFALALVRGTEGDPYTFGEPPNELPIEVPAFYIGVVPTTQAFWSHIAGADRNPAIHRGPDHPVENVSWELLTQPGGFLQQLNESGAAASLREQVGHPVEFRLPTETEWEYAARGGPSWKNRFRFSGSNDIDTVAWYDRVHGDWTQPVALKAANQLGLFDMCGNVWEWCQDTHSPDVKLVPTDGSPFIGPGEDRVLRGGCFHNWAMHCTVSKRYEIGRQYQDGCVGFRVVLS